MIEQIFVVNVYACILAAIDDIYIYILYIYRCPLLLGRGGPTCCFMAIFWGGGPPNGL